MFLTIILSSYLILLKKTNLIKILIKFLFPLLFIPCIKIFMHYSISFLDGVSIRKLTINVYKL